jgi:hypothetical protein
MPAMDLNTYLSTPEAYVNYMNCSTYNGHSENAIFESFYELFKLLPKFKYKVKYIAGDLYYEEMSAEETR